jgi:hypothetical protein
MSAAADLTARPDAGDRLLAELVAGGRTSAQIAARLGVTHGVARYRLRRAMERAGADSGPEFAALLLPGRNVPGVEVPKVRVAPRYPQVIRGVEATP